MDRPEPRDHRPRRVRRLVRVGEGARRGGRPSVISGRSCRWWLHPTDAKLEKMTRRCLGDGERVARAVAVDTGAVRCTPGTGQPLHVPAAKLRLSKSPTVLVLGEKDGLIGNTTTAASRRNIPDCEIEILPRAGHIMNIDEPEPHRHPHRQVPRCLRTTSSERLSHGDLGATLATIPTQASASDDVQWETWRGWAVPSRYGSRRAPIVWRGAPGSAPRTVAHGRSRSTRRRRQIWRWRSDGPGTAGPALWLDRAPVGSTCTARTVVEWQALGGRRAAHPGGPTAMRVEILARDRVLEPLRGRHRVWTFVIGAASPRRAHAVSGGRAAA